MTRGVVALASAIDSCSTRSCTVMRNTSRTDGQAMTYTPVLPDIPGIRISSPSFRSERTRENASVGLVNGATTPRSSKVAGQYRVLRWPPSELPDSFTASVIGPPLSSPGPTIAENAVQRIIDSKEASSPLGR